MTLQLSGSDTNTSPANIAAGTQSSNMGEDFSNLNGEIPSKNDEIQGVRESANTASVNATATHKSSLKSNTNGNTNADPGRNESQDDADVEMLTELDPPLHQPSQTQSQEEAANDTTTTNDNDKEDATAPKSNNKEKVPKKEYIMKIILPRKEIRDTLEDFFLEMINEDRTMTALPYEKESNLPNIDGKTDFPDDINEFYKYFVKLPPKRNVKTDAFVIRVSSQYSHVEWRERVAEYLARWKIKIQRQQLESIKTVTTGFMLRKDVQLTQLNHYDKYLAGILTKAPKFASTVLHPSIKGGFDGTVKTEVLAFITGEEDANAFDEAMRKKYPARQTGQVYISYRQKIPDDEMREIYLAHNKWMRQTERIPVGEFRNIDRQYEIGLHRPVSFREFIRGQPTRPDEVKRPIDAENGGLQGRATIIVNPRDREYAKSLYNEFLNATRKALSDDDKSTTSSAHSKDLSMAKSYRESLMNVIDLTSDSDPEETYNEAPKRSTRRNRRNTTYAAVTRQGTHKQDTSNRRQARKRNRSKDNSTPLSRQKQETLPQSILRKSTRRPAQQVTPPEEDRNEKNGEEESTAASMSSLSAATDADSMDSKRMLNHLWKEMEKLKVEQKEEKKRHKKMELNQAKTIRELQATALLRQNQFQYLCRSIEQLSQADDDTTMQSIATSLAESVRAAMSMKQGDSEPQPERPPPTIQFAPTEEALYDQRVPPKTSISPERRKSDISYTSDEGSEWKSSPKRHTAPASSSLTADAQSVEEDTRVANRYAALDPLPLSPHKKKKRTTSPKFKKALDDHLDKQNQSPRSFTAGIAGAASSVANTIMNTVAPAAVTNEDGRLDEDKDMDYSDTAKALFTQPEDAVMEGAEDDL